MPCQRAGITGGCHLLIPDRSFRAGAPDPLAFTLSHRGSEPPFFISHIFSYA